MATSLYSYYLRGVPTRVAQVRARCLLYSQCSPSTSTTVVVLLYSGCMPCTSLLVCLSTIRVGNGWCLFVFGVRARTNWRLLGHLGGDEESRLLETIFIFFCSCCVIKKPKVHVLPQQCSVRTVQQWLYTPLFLMTINTNSRVASTYVFVLSFAFTSLLFLMHVTVSAAVYQQCHHEDGDGTYTIPLSRPLYKARVLVQPWCFFFLRIFSNFLLNRFSCIAVSQYFVLWRSTTGSKAKRGDFWSREKVSRLLVYDRLPCTAVVLLWYLYYSINTIILLSVHVRSYILLIFDVHAFPYPNGQQVKCAGVVLMYTIICILLLYHYCSSNIYIESVCL